MESISTPDQVNARVGIHLHLHYSDLVDHFVKYLNRVPLNFDLLVSFSGDVTRERIESSYKSLKNCRRILTKQVPNIGRDIAPLVCKFPRELSQYDIVAHIHGKKSLYNNGATAGWLEYLCDNLFSSEKDLLKLFSLLTGDSQYGIVYPLNFHVLPSQANTWLANKGRAHTVANRIGISDLPDTYIDYPAGSMFWARTEALAKLFAAGFTYDDFDPEQGQRDGTLAHAIERLFAIIAKSQGYKAGILQDKNHPTWSPWRFDRYDNRQFSDATKTILSEEIKLVAFDVFDTLLCRPMLDPDMTKDIVAESLDAQLGSNFKKLRHEAERIARTKAKRDVGLSHIYDEFTSLTGCTQIDSKNIRSLEERTEVNSLRPREDGQKLFRAAVSAGKRVVLISDMFLDSTIITEALERNGVTGWDAIYVSSEVGIRKDSGELYKKVLEEQNVAPRNALMIGDNERSDWQIPTDMGMRTIHLPRAVDRARANIRFAPLIEAVERHGSIDAHITTGLIVQNEFSKTFDSKRDPSALIETKPYTIGQSVLGPLVTSFSSWLSASTKGIPDARLFFLAREGAALKTAYEAWTNGEQNATPASYLLVSRRCVNVAAIESINDIIRIAESDYLLNTAAIFLRERYGVEPTDEEWQDITAKSGWTSDKIFEIKQKDTANVLPLLQATENLIMQRVTVERPGLLAYLDATGFSACRNPILVDVGYSGTIQGALMRILKRDIWGKYMATDSAISKINYYGTDVSKGFFADKVERTASSPFVLRESFLLEKLLSSDDAQVIYHEILENKSTITHFRELTDQEIQVRPVRREIRAGMLDFIEAARAIKGNLKRDFSPPQEAANMIYEHYVSGASEAEAQLSRQIVLDDFYCGRGIVS